MNGLTFEEQTVLDLVKKYDGIGISQISAETRLTLTEVYEILLKLSLCDLITFKKDGLYGIKGQ